ncbi:MAG: hypothetical protein ABJH98_06630 [Reichenbachiella sp.]|uniref:hypothetical protein n=1 Tax=Reichenbachiella sp. TaxID=2184521 RepID=UPI003296E1E8
MPNSNQKDLLQKYTILNLGIGVSVPLAVISISQLYPQFFYNHLVIWISFILAVFIIIWMLLNMAKASSSKYIRLPGLILWGVASPLTSIFLFGAVYFGTINQVTELSFTKALEFSFSAFIRKTSPVSSICDCQFFEISQNYLGYLLFAYAIAVIIQGINFRRNDQLN